MKAKVSVYWMRRDLRLDDNAALWKALKSGNPVMVVFIFDKNILDKLTNKKDARVTFIHNRLQEIQKDLNDLGSNLFTFYSNPIEVFTHLVQEYDVKAVFANRDYEPYALERDKSIYELLDKNKIPFKGSKDHVIFEKDEVLKDDGKPYTIYTPYSKKWKSKLNAFYLKSYPTEKYFNAFFRVKKKSIHVLAEMGFDESDCAFPSDHVNKAIVASYHLTRDIPSLRGTSRLSLHLRFGTISIRKLTTEVSALNEKYLNELIWRDFYQMILFHFPHSARSAFKPAYDRIQWLYNEDQFNAWKEGKTGYPLVDAGMRELNKTGFMHNRVRMVVASFLTKHLLHDWRLGEAYFAEKLLDFDLASNVGGWQWAAGSGCDAAPYFRVFNPQAQLEKFDPEYKYVKMWVPEHGTPAYPKPIVDHKMARERCLSVYKDALK
ncbi:MAG: cryptochrome/photolyase family protein [Flavobacteriales bacterium]